MVHPGIWSRQGGQIGAALAGDSKSYDIEHRIPFGRTAPCAGFTSRPTSSATEGKAVSMVGVVRDITSARPEERIQYLAYYDA